jgi:hypothetical protein
MEPPSLTPGMYTRNLNYFIVKLRLNSFHTLLNFIISVLSVKKVYSAYVRVCVCIAGTSQQVATRRNVIDTCEMVRNKAASSDQNTMMTSGSDRKGFRMKGSDMDSMFWFNIHPVIWDLSQTQLYNVHQKFPILSIFSESPPGFTLLRLLSPLARKKVISAQVTINGRRYISSAKYREL